LRPIWDFQPYGQSGKMLSEIRRTAGNPSSNDLAFVHNMVGKSGVHSAATLLQATGFQLPVSRSGLLGELRPSAR